MSQPLTIGVYELRKNGAVWDYYLGGHIAGQMQSELVVGALDALSAAQRENETMREALRDIRDNFDHETYTRQHGPQGYSGNCRCCVAYAALSGQGGR